jgi:hypothetical protein
MDLSAECDAFILMYDFDRILKVRSFTTEYSTIHDITYVLIS